MLRWNCAVEGEGSVSYRMGFVLRALGLAGAAFVSINAEAQDSVVSPLPGNAAAGPTSAAAPAEASAPAAPVMPAAPAPPAAAPTPEQVNITAPRSSGIA